MAISNEYLKRTTPDIDAVLSERIYSEEFRKFIQTQKRFREVWMELDAPWNHELFQYANEDFYFYRFNVSRMEKNTHALLKDIIFRLLTLYKADWSKGTAPILFKCKVSSSSTVGYTFDDFYENDDLDEICNENRIDKVFVIRIWKGAQANEWVARENSQYESHGISIRAIGISDFFVSQFGKDECQRFEAQLTTFLKEIFDLVGYRSIKFLSSMNLAAQKLVLEKKLLEYASNKMCYTIVDRSKPELQKYLYVDGYNFPVNIEKIIQSNFVKNDLFRVLLGSAEFAESFVTSEWLFHSLEGTEHYDYTSIISGYLKSVEQLLLQIVRANVDNNCKITLKSNKKNDAIHAGVSRYTFVFDKKKKAYVFRPILDSSKFPVEYIDLKSNQMDYMDSDLGTFEYFLRNNPDVFFSQLQQQSTVNKKSYCAIIADMVSCFRAECRNGYFHTHNLKDWDTVVKIRKNALMIYTLLLGGCDLPTSKTDILKMPAPDWFDTLCMQIQNNRRATLDYVFEYSDNHKVCAVFDFRNNTKEYTDTGMEHYDSLRFYCVPDFSIESYERIDDGSFDSSIITLTRESVPYKIFAVNRNKQKTLLYEAAN